MNDKPYHVDSERTRSEIDTGFLVRAQDEDGKWGATDISRLYLKSLLRWLRSRGGKNRFAETVIATVLGHEREAIDGCYDDNDELIP